MESILLSDLTLVKWCIQGLHGLCCMHYRFFSLFRWLILVLMAEWGILPIPHRFSTAIANHPTVKSAQWDLKEAYLCIYWTFVRNQISENIRALFLKGQLNDVQMQSWYSSEILKNYSGSAESQDTWYNCKFLIHWSGTHYQ